MKPQELLALADRVDASRSENATDVLVEIALFEPNETVKGIRSNDAGTKVVYTYAGGKDVTAWAFDWTMDDYRADTSARLRALATSRSQRVDES